ncbi:hypothetical protein KEM48_004651 [Puccinia striiformis f. sp. tritici PST-130]|uniref:Uncharacterized protein n=1 Tax=Puccinia striiformis f. sp. tritici PST-78 TaxID=1165861 RepID=A0A0L0VZL0_9BASI|nr:hypothetical protein Pst134EB_023400 [Puccinia striiformis f. sp. tritici]KAI9611179.1 hypothetical protein KEM48_004651 [Puccinia striiformis f. sp. tritici PST-130]KNF04440.1 hypothetical protein PSTG_02355 [Puccinia striiformis f. sp. tritici PST-78]
MTLQTRFRLGKFPATNACTRAKGWMRIGKDPPRLLLTPDPRTTRVSIARSRGQNCNMRWSLIIAYSALCLAKLVLLSLPNRIPRDEGRSANELVLPDLNEPLLDESFAEPLCPPQTTISSSFSAKMSTPERGAVDQQPVSGDIISTGKRESSSVNLMPAKRRKVPPAATIGPMLAFDHKAIDLFSKAHQKKPSSTSGQSILLTSAQGRMSPDGAARESGEPRSTSEEITNSQSTQLIEDIAEIERSEGGVQKLYPELSERFDLYDWKFLLSAPDKSTDTSTPQVVSSSRSLEKFFDTVKVCESKPKGKKGKDYFWINRKEAAVKLGKFGSVKLGCAFPSEFDGYSKDTALRYASLFRVVLTLSNMRLVLESYRIFSVDLLENLKNILQSKKEEMDNFRSQLIPVKISESTRKYRTRCVPWNKVLRIMEYVKNSTKIATFLVIIHLSLFREHEGDFLTRQEVRDIVGFFRKMWLDIESGNGALVEKYSWAKIHWALLSLGSRGTTYEMFRYTESYVYQMAWNFVHYWAESNKKTIRKGFKMGKDKHKTIVELVNKLLYFSNYEAILEIAEQIKQAQSSVKL